jgi:hypothetical protein
MYRFAQSWAICLRIAACFRGESVPPRGVEPNAKTTGKNDVSSGQRAKSDAIDPETARNGPDLVTIIEAWPQLPEAVKADIVAMVRASRK